MVTGGPGRTVQIDESKFGKNKYGTGRPVKGGWLFGGAEEGSTDCFAEVSF